MRLYEMDTTKLSFREYWRWRPGIPFLHLAVKKILGIRFNTGQFYARPEACLPIPADDLPEPHRSVLRSLVEESAKLGFVPHLYYCTPTVGRATGATAVLLDAELLSILQLVHAAPRDSLVVAPAAYAFYSCAKDGRILATSGGLPGLGGGSPEIQVHRIRHGTLGQTWERHSERISTEKHEFIPFRPQGVADWLLRMLQVKFDHNVSRGIFIPKTEFDFVRVSASGR